MTPLASAWRSRLTASVTRYLVEDDVHPTGYSQVFDELNQRSSHAHLRLRLATYQMKISCSMARGHRVSMDTMAAATFASSLIPTADRHLRDDAYGNSFTKSGTTPNNYLYRGEQSTPTSACIICALGITIQVLGQILLPRSERRRHRTESAIFAASTSTPTAILSTASIRWEGKTLLSALKCRRRVGARLFLLQQDFQLQW